jgi:hypothetical protein
VLEFNLRIIRPQAYLSSRRKNVVAVALSCLSVNPNSIAIVQQSQCAECFGSTKDHLPVDIHPIKLSQQQDKFAHCLLQTSQHYNFQTFCGGEVERTLICYKDKIAVLNDPQKNGTMVP